MDGFLNPENNTIVDPPLRFIGSENISSVFNRTGSVPVNDIQAMQYSSNVYMATVAMRMGGYWDYEPNRTLPIDGPETIEKMRRYYRQFGLGSETGIDLPGESTGQPGLYDNPAQALFLSFGQFDTYTPLQLAQYSSTIASGGIRFAPRLVSEIRGTNGENGEVGSLIQETQPKIMNTIDVAPNIIDRVQRGMYQVVNGDYGFAPGVFADAPYEAAGKTGTAEAFYWGEEVNRRLESVTNMTFVGFAPYDNPEIAIAVVVPYLPNQNTGISNLEISRQMFDAYFGVGEYEDEDPTTEGMKEEASEDDEEE